MQMKDPVSPNKITYIDEETVEVRGFIFDKTWGEMFSYLNFSNVNGYARFSGNKFKNEFLHHIIMGHRPNRKVVVDHINGNTKDNRKYNLRVVTQSENCLNRGVYVDASIGRWSSKKGHKRTKEWSANVWDNWKSKNIGWFATREEAVEARRKYLIENGYRILGEKRPKK